VTEVADSLQTVFYAVESPKPPICRRRANRRSRARAPPPAGRPPAGQPSAEAEGLRPRKERSPFFRSLGDGRTHVLSGPLARLSRKRLAGPAGPRPLFGFLARDHAGFGARGNKTAWRFFEVCPRVSDCTDPIPCRQFPPRLAPMPRMRRSHPTRLRRVALRALMAWHPDGSGLMCASPSPRARAACRLDTSPPSDHS